VKAYFTKAFKKLLEMSQKHLLGMLAFSFHIYQYYCGGVAVMRAGIK